MLRDFTLRSPPCARQILFSHVIVMVEINSVIFKSHLEICIVSYSIVV